MNAQGRPLEFENTYPYSRMPYSEESSLHLSKFCGNWQSDYIHLQEREVQQNRVNGTGKFLVFSSCGRGIDCGGAGDNLVAIASTFMLAIVFNRGFLVEWPELAETQLFEPATFDWRIDGNVQIPQNVSTFTACNITGSYGSSVELDFMNFGNSSEAAMIFDCLESLSHVQSIRIHMNRGFTHWALSQTNTTFGQKLQKLGFRMPFISGCLLKFLFRSVTIYPVNLYSYLVVN